MGGVPCCLAFLLPTLSSSSPSFRVVLTLGGASLSGRTQEGGFGLGPGPSEVGSEFWRMTAPRALGVAVGVGTAAGSGSWEAGKAARFRVGWSCRDWDRGTGAAYGFSGTRCATRLCRERPGRVGCLLWGTPCKRGSGLRRAPPPTRRQGVSEAGEEDWTQCSSRLSQGWAPGCAEDTGDRAHVLLGTALHLALSKATRVGKEWGQTHLVRSFLRFHRPLHRRSLGKRSRRAGRGLGDGGLWPHAAWLRLGQGRVLLLIHPCPVFHLRRKGPSAGQCLRS